MIIFAKYYQIKYSKYYQNFKKMRESTTEKKSYPAFFISSGQLNFFGVFSNKKECFELMLVTNKPISMSQASFYRKMDTIDFGDFVEIETEDKNGKYRIYKALQNKFYSCLDVML